MSTYDVPGANPSNGDALAMGCWAEHRDRSLILVQSAEDSRVIYSIFDVSKTPIVEYRDAMPEETFKRRFSGGAGGAFWTWHDKTAFPWDRVIRAGASDGPRFASADDELTAAERIAEDLRLRSRNVDYRDLEDRREQMREIHGLIQGLQGAIERLAR